MVIEGSRRGVFTMEGGKIAAEKLTRTDQVPAALKKALGIISLANCAEITLDTQPPLFYGLPISK